MRERARPRYVPSSGFCNLSTASSTSCFAGLFHPAATSRVTSVQGFVPVSQGPRLVAVTLPPCRFSALAHHFQIRPLRTVPLVVVTCVPFDFEALLRDPVRFASRLFKPACVRAPLRFLLPQALTAKP